MKISIKILALCVLINFCEPMRKFDANNFAFFLLRVKGRNFSADEEFTIHTKEKLDHSAYNPKFPPVFLIHGFMEDRKVAHHLNISLNLLETMNEINLFFIDWGKGAKVLDYKTAYLNALEVMRVFGEFYNFLHKKYSIDSSKVTCVGFSLGAQICGLVYQHINGEKFGKVIGLDPAGPKFDIEESKTRINPASAFYVECIHTGYDLGIRAPVCQADFFVNKGSKQPGCEMKRDGQDNVVCSHTRAARFFNESITNPLAFYGRPCASLDAVLAGECEENKEGAFMNHPDNSKNKLTGIFALETNDDFPFGRGKH